jgi:hypothetical protein
MPKATTPQKKNEQRLQPKASAAYFLSLTLQNVRCFGAEPQTLDLSDGKGRPARWTILLGDNGTGKTTVLQSLAAFHLLPDGFKGIFRVHWFFNRMGQRTYDLIRSGEPNFTLSAKIAQGQKLNAPIEQYDFGERRFEIVRNRSFASFSNSVQTEPLTCYGYGAGRHPGISSHSPLIAQAASDANIVLRRREGDHVVIDNRGGAIRGWRIDQVLTSDLFGLPTARPPEFDDLLARRKQLLTKPRLTKADKRELAELEAKIGTLPDGETAAEAERLALIESTLELLKSKIGDPK